MARKQNKSAKTIKKESSFNVSTKKGGKVVKKLPDSKLKKQLESQIKQVAKLQGKSNKSKVKPISPANTGRRSSRTNTNNNKTSTPASQRTSPGKISTSKKTVSSTSTAKVQAAGKRKSNSTETLENKKRGSTTNLRQPNKNETSQSDKKKAGNTMSLRGKKRSYSQLASGNKVEGNNETKKRKAVNTKDVTSRGNRSIKPTIKGSEWRNTILQRKSTGAKQEKTTKEEGKSQLKNKRTAATNKSHKQSKNTSPSKSPAVIRSGSKTDNTTSPKLKRQSGSGTSTQKVQKVTPSKGKLKNTTKFDTVSGKSPKSRSTSRKSSIKPGEDEKTPSKVNTLVSSIKNKFSSCVGNKRKLRGSDLQENVLVAQEILHDILNSVGTPDMLPTDEKSEDTGDGITVTSVPQILPMKVIDEDSLCETKKESSSECLSQTSDTDINESKLSCTLLKEEKPFSDTNSETIVEVIDNNPNENLGSDKKVDVEVLHPAINVEEISASNEYTGAHSKNNDDAEKMELRLSDTSTTSENDNGCVSSGNKTTIDINNDKINQTGLSCKIDDQVNSILVTEINDKLMKNESDQESKPSEQVQNEKVAFVNGNDCHSDSVAASTLDNNKGGLCHVVNEKKGFSKIDTVNEEVSANKKVSPLQPENSHDSLDARENSPFVILESPQEKSIIEEKEGACVKKTFESQEKVLENTTDYEEKSHKDGTYLTKVVQNNYNEDETSTSKNENSRAPNIQTNHSKIESSFTETNFESSDDIAEEHAKVKESPEKSQHSKVGRITHCFMNETKSVKELNSFEHESNSFEYEDTLNDGTNKQEIITTQIKESSGFTNNHTTTLDVAKNKLTHSTNIEQSELIIDKHSLILSNGGESIPCVLSSQKSDGLIVDSSSKTSSKTEEITGPGIQSSLSIFHEKQEIMSNDVAVSNVNKNVDLHTNVVNSNECLQSDSVNLKETSTTHSTSTVKSNKELNEHCLESKEEVYKNELRFQAETSPNTEKSKLNELKDEEINVDTPRPSENLCDESSSISPNTVEETSKMSSDTQNVINNKTVSDNTDSHNPVSENSMPQEVVLEKHSLASEEVNNSSHSAETVHVISKHDQTKGIPAVDENSDQTSAGGSDLKLEHDAAEIQIEVPSKMSSSATVDNNSPTDQLDSTEKLNQNFDSSTEVKDTTLGSSTNNETISVNEPIISEDLEKLNQNSDSSTEVKDTTLGSSTNIETISVNEPIISEDLQEKKVATSSSDIEKNSVGEKLISEDLQENKETNSTTNLTEDIKKVTLENSDSSSQFEQTSVDKISTEEINKNIQNDEKVALETSLQSSNSTCPTEEIVSNTIGMPAVDVGITDIGEDFSKMEEANQEEITQDSIIVDDTDGESMQCNSETQSSNRMSVDEENSGMEVDPEEVTADVNACSTSVKKVEGEMNMEVS